MKETTKIKLIELLEIKLGRRASDTEKANAMTDFNLISEVTLKIAEENQERTEVLDTNVKTLDADIKKVDAKLTSTK